MRRSPLVLFVFCFALLSGCDDPELGADAGMDGSTPIETDSGMPEMDASSGDDDGGRPGDDGGTDEGDGGTTDGEDGGTDREDGGTDREDGGTGGEDGGTDPDGGTGEPDAGGEPASCSDGMTNGDETDVDCGGSTCAARCEATEMCAVRGDCASGVCIGNVCQATSCSDGIQNGDETDVDCGGSCGGCPNGDRCMGNDDCAVAGSMCSGGYCLPGSCLDGTQNGSETDVDCGGGTCAPCSDGDACKLARDCASNICMGEICLPLECTNGVQDGNEVGVDCGGDCPGCPTGNSCTDDVDCLSGRCEDGMCASCSDGVQSGDETDVDCGGETCGPCSRGKACLVDTDCAFGSCLEDGTCDGPTEFYRESFEGGDGGWVADSGSDWEHGTPMKSILDGAHSGDGAWATKLMGDYSNGQNNFVTSPSIDLSASADDPAIELAVVYSTEASTSATSTSAWDGARLEVSTDGGTTWRTVGDMGTGLNWYDRTLGTSGPGGPIWAGGSGGWRVASHVLTGTAGESDVRLRMRFRSDGSNSVGSLPYEGFAFDDVVIRAPIPNLTVSVRAVPDVCGQVVASVTNTGEMTAPSATFRYGIGSSLTTVELTDFEPGATEARTFFATDGDTIVAEVTSAYDENPTDDFASATLTSVTFPVDGANPYFEDFEAGEGGWMSMGTNNSWEHGIPAGTVIDAAHSGSAAWVTNLEGNYAANERSYLISPCFDATDATADLRVSFAHIFETETRWDTGWLDYSVDGGESWTRVVGGEDATNWGSSNSWDGSSEGWRIASAILPGTAGKPRVRIRHGFDSDGSSHREGFGFDDVRLAISGEPDLSVEMRRTASCGRVEAVVTNVGTAPARYYALTLTADGVDQRMTVLDPILPGEAVVYSIEARSLAGALAEAPGDSDPSNDQDMIQPSIVVTGGYSEDFEAGDGGYLAGGTNSSWEHGEPAGAFITGPAGGVNAWVTNLDGNYSANERSTLTSPCFDFSALTSDPELSFAHIFQTEGMNDWGWVEISLDAGATWQKLGRTGTGTNWYNRALVDWWEGTSGAAGTWRTASHPLTGSAGHEQVRFRFVLHTDGSYEYEGFGVDDISITP